MATSAAVLHHGGTAVLANVAYSPGREKLRDNNVVGDLPLKIEEIHLPV